MRWVLKLSLYNFTVVYKKGAANIVPDYLSRKGVNFILSVVDGGMEEYVSEMEKEREWSSIYKALRKE